MAVVILPSGNPLYNSADPGFHGKPVTGQMTRSIHLTRHGYQTCHGSGDPSQVSLNYSVNIPDAARQYISILQRRYCRRMDSPK